MERDTAPRRRVLVLYLQSRGFWWLLSAMVLTAVLIVTMGFTAASLPTAAEQAPPGRLWRLLTSTCGALAVTTLTSRLQGLEATAGHSFHRCRTLVFVAAALLSVALVLAAVVLAGHGDSLPQVLRAVLAWLGLGLIAGRVLGWRASWAGPVAAIGPITFWGYDGAAHQYVWWDVSARPGDDPVSGVLALALLAAGVLALWVTPWRLASTRRTIISLVATPVRVVMRGRR